jgi:transcription initiation factor TFIIA large subunit
MPVQITIPAQPGQPNSVQKALTVQVPAHALQHGSPTSTILQQVLTQGITQALSIQDSTQAAFYLQAQINNALRINVSGNL